MDARIPLSVTTSTLPASGTPETPASSRTRRNCDATDVSAAADRSEPSIPRDPFSTGNTAVRPNKKEQRSDCSCVSEMIAPQTEASMF
jgi:hypothetical protein